MTSILTQSAVQIAALVLAGLFFLNQTRKQGLILSLLAMVAWLGVVVIVVDVMAQELPDIATAISKQIIIINETEFVESKPIVLSITEQEIVILPNEQAQAVAAVPSANWGSTQLRFPSAQLRFLGTQLRFPSQFRSLGIPPTVAC